MKSKKQTRFGFTVNESLDSKGVVGFIYADSPEIAAAMHARIQGLGHFRNARFLIASQTPEAGARPMAALIIEHGYSQDVMRYTLRQAE